MKLKDIVCDFEYAERLKELGVKRESIYMIGESGKGVSNE